MKATYHDRGNRLRIRATLACWPDDRALAAAEKLRPEGWRLLRMSARADPTRGRRVYLELQWVSPEWVARKKLESGRSSPIAPNSVAPPDAEQRPHGTEKIG